MFYEGSIEGFDSNWEVIQIGPSSFLFGAELNFKTTSFYTPNYGKLLSDSDMSSSLEKSRLRFDFPDSMQVDSLRAQNQGPAENQTITIEGEKFINGPLKTTPVCEGMNVVNIDYVLVSNFEDFFGLPFLIQSPLFHGQIILTHPIMKLGVKILEELLGSIEKRNKRIAVGKDGDVDEEDELEFESDVYDYFEKKHGVFLTELVDFPDTSIIEKLLEKFVPVNYGQKVKLPQGMSVEAGAAGLDLGSSFWTFFIGTQTVSVLQPIGLHNYRHPKQFDFKKLIKSDVIIISPRAVASEPQASKEREMEVEKGKKNEKMEEEDKKPPENKMEIESKSQRELREEQKGNEEVPGKNQQITQSQADQIQKETQRNPSPNKSSKALKEEQLVRKKSNLSFSEVELRKFYEFVHECMSSGSNLLLPVHNFLSILDFFDFFEHKLPHCRSLVLIGQSAKATLAIANVWVEFLSQPFMNKILSTSPMLPFSFNEMVEKKRLRLYKDLKELQSDVSAFGTENFLKNNTPTIYMVTDSSFKMGFAAKMFELLNNSKAKSRICFLSPHEKDQALGCLHRVNKMPIYTFNLDKKIAKTELVSLLNRFDQEKTAQGKTKNSQIFLPEKLGDLLQNQKMNVPFSLFKTEGRCSLDTRVPLKKLVTGFKTLGGIDYEAPDYHKIGDGMSINPLALFPSSQLRETRGKPSKEEPMIEEPQKMTKEIEKVKEVERNKQKIGFMESKKEVVQSSDAIIKRIQDFALESELYFPISVSESQIRLVPQEKLILGLPEEQKNNLKEEITVQIDTQPVLSINIHSKSTESYEKAVKLISEAMKVQMTN